MPCKKVCFTPHFPKGIWSALKGLRNLYVHSNLELDLSNIPPRILTGEPLRNLQVLSLLEMKQNTALAIAKFPSIKKLGLRFGEEVEECEVEKLMASIWWKKVFVSLRYVLV